MNPKPDREKRVASHVAYYAKNKEKLIAYEAAYYAENQEKIAASQAALPEAMQKQLAASVERDVAELVTHLEERGAAALADASAKLTERCKEETAGLVRILEDQRKRVVAELEKGEDDWMQLPLALDDERRKREEEERKQRKADMKYWQDWLANVDDDLEREPKRIRDFYTVQTHRVEPLGLVYLWPVEGR